MAETIASRDFGLAAAADCPILQIEGWAGGLHEFEANVARALSVALPETVGETVQAAGFLVVRIAPRRLWLIAEADGAMPTLEIDPGLGCAVALGEGRVRMTMAGPRMFEVLSQCVAVDWHSPGAAPGRAVQTSFHHVPVLLLRTSEDACDLIAPRSFARSLAEWTADAAA